jgi:hypothetical protein
MATNALTNTANYLGFNLSPSPTSGQGAYGAVPGQLGLPASTYQESLSAMPQLAGLGTQTATNVGAQLSGTLSPGTMGTLQDKAAAFGVNVGTPFTGTGGSLPLADYLESIGSSSEALTQTGTSNYMNFLGGIGQQQLSPDLTSSIAQSNATMAAAPDPSQAVSAEQDWIKQYMAMMNPATGTSDMSTNPSGLQQWWTPTGTTQKLPGYGY